MPSVSPVRARLRTAGTATLTTATAMALTLPALSAAAVQDDGAAISSQALGQQSVIDPSVVSTSTDPAIAATQPYRQFPYVLSIPSGKGTANTPRTVLMSYNVSMDVGTVAEKLQTKRSTDGGATWTNLTQAVPLTTTVRTKTGLLYSVNFRTSATSTPPTPISATPAPVLEKPGVGGNVTAPTLSDATNPDGTKPSAVPEADLSLKRFTTRYWTSTDNGASWATAVGSASVPWSVTDLYFHRSIVIAPNGQWLATAYAHKTGDVRWSSFLLSSDDQGATWRGVSEIGTSLQSGGEGVVEPSIEFNSRGQLMMAYRMRAQINPNVCRGSLAGNTPVATAVSNDLGRTWTNARQVIISGQITGSADPQLVRSPTGQLLLSVGRPYNQILISQDGTGDTWTPSVQSATIISSGYTSLVPIGVGTQFRQFGDLGSNWCYSTANGATRTAGIFSVPFWMRPADARLIDIGTGLQSGVMKITGSTFSAKLSSNSTAQALADGSVEPDAGLVAPGASGTFTLDLGNVYMLRGIGLAMPTARVAATAQFSADGVNWTNAASWAASDQYRALTDRATTMTRTRYVRISASAASQALVSELRLYTNFETFEAEIPGSVPAGLTAQGTNANARVLAASGSGWQSTTGLRITDNSSVAMPRLVTATPAQKTSFTGFRFNPAKLTTALTVTANARQANGTITRGMHAGLFPDGSVRRYDGTKWIVVAPAGTVPKGTWSYVSVYANGSAGEINVNGKAYKFLPRTTAGGVFVGTTISAGGTATVGDDFLIDNLYQE